MHLENNEDQWIFVLILKNVVGEKCKIDIDEYFKKLKL